MKEITLNKREAVAKFGTDAQKEHFLKHGKLKSKSLEEALIKTIKQYYENFRTEKQGRSIVYVVSGKREKIAEREDGRENNGQNQLPFEEVVKNLTLAYLNNRDISDDKTITVNNLAHKMGLMSDTLFFASKQKTHVQKKQYYEKLDGKYKIGQLMFYHIVQQESARINRNLDSILKRMAKAKIIFYRDTTVAFLGNDNKYKILDNEQALEIKEKQKELRQKHSLEFYQIKYNLKHQKVFDYKKDEREYFDSMGFLYTYDAKTIGLIATDREIKKYMKDNLIADFKDAFSNYVEKLAQASQDKFYTELIKNKDNKELIEQLGGHEKPNHAIFIGTEHERIIKEDAHRLIYDGVVQAKSAKTYPKEYKNGFKKNTR